MLDRRSQTGIAGVRADKEIKHFAGYPGVHRGIGPSVPFERSCGIGLARIVNPDRVVSCRPTKPIPLAGGLCLGKGSWINQQGLAVS